MPEDRRAPLATGGTPCTMRPSGATVTSAHLMSTTAPTPTVSPRHAPPAAGGSQGHGAAVFASFLGWTLDAFDFFLVVMTLTAIAKDFGRADKDLAFSLTLTFAFRPVGAFLFGLLA